MKKKEVNINEESTSAGGAHAVNKFRISDFVMMAVIVILCASCVLPFLHVAVKSISGNTAVMSKSVYFWPKDITFDAYKKVFADNSMMYLCRLSSFQEETEGQKVTDFPADGTDVLQCRHHSQLPVISEAACAGYHVGVDLTSDLFPVQHADHEELLPEYDSRQLRGIRFPGWRK